MATETPTAEKKGMDPVFRQNLIRYGGAGLAILVIAASAAYLILSNSRVYIDTASISAPLINLAPTVSGRLNALYVNPGDTVSENAPVALVGTEVIKAKVAGLIVNVNDTVGAQIPAGTPVVTMIDPSQLRVVGQLDENKGLANITVGDPVVFTVDAFGGKQFKGVVDEVAPTSNQSDIVFSVSDARQEMKFDVKARFDILAYPQLKNGMSARMWVYQP